MWWPWNRQPKVEPTIVPGAIRKRLRYTGKVQAVGFRFTVDGCADEAGVTGWVKNMDDGSVLCEVQGTPEQVHDFMRLVQEQIDKYLPGGRHFIDDALIRSSLQKAADAPNPNDPVKLAELLQGRDDVILQARASVHHLDRLKPLIDCGVRLHLLLGPDPDPLVSNRLVDSFKDKYL